MPAVQIVCPSCSSKLTYVISSSQDNDGKIVRRRKCKPCNHKWYTLQLPEVQVSKYNLTWHKGKATFNSTLK